METEYFATLLKEKRKFLFIGEAGSGKSEMAINFAMAFVKLTAKNVHFFDMDQTKPIFRSREAKDQITANGIHFHSAKQLLDIRTIPHAVIETLTDEQNVVVLDVGGDATGAMNIGQFSEYLNQDNAAVYFVLNCYRPFSHKQEYIARTMREVGQATALSQFRFISNPNLGPTTTLEEVVEGHRMTLALLKKLDCEVNILAVLKSLYRDDLKQAADYVIPISSYIMPPWQRRTKKGVESNG